ncbi:hypothetical protein LPB19_03480 [Marinobacter salinisoli]|uniref:DUF4124 domain-containing protein n=1 Tax=Marinobacter salinisoli TaxID=2769486 RepID=A0ABX7MT43_9GAMM|nr:hypothetical protein [Marinobacter salinisoli]QSP95491.1 hypothetical protein LPB19_03480 [Marinobacter salinisoli]
MKKMLLLALIGGAFYVFYLGPKQAHDDCIRKGGELNVQEGTCTFDINFTISPKELEKQITSSKE